MSGKGVFDYFWTLFTLPIKLLILAVVVAVVVGGSTEEDQTTQQTGVQLDLVEKLNQTLDGYYHGWATPDEVLAVAREVVTVFRYSDSGYRSQAVADRLAKVQEVLAGVALTSARDKDARDAISLALAEWEPQRQVQDYFNSGGVPNRNTGGDIEIKTGDTTPAQK
jgi:hypothetical protein